MQSIITITTSTPISELDWGSEKHVGRIGVDGNWVDMVSIDGDNTPVPTAVIDGSDISNSSLALFYDNGVLGLSVAGNQRITAIEIYAEPFQAN